MPSYAKGLNTAEATFDPEPLLKISSVRFSPTVVKVVFAWFVCMNAERVGRWGMVGRFSKTNKTNKMPNKKR
jgi:hypothetical protein